MAIESFAAAHWDGRVLALPGHAHASASLDIDGIWFDDLRPGPDGALRLELAYSPSGMLSAYEWIRYQMATQKADFFTAHDPDAFKAMKKAPEFYD